MLFSKPSASSAAIALSASNFAAFSIVQMARRASNLTSTFFTPCRSARVSRTLGAHPVGQVLPGTLKTTICRFASSEVVEPDDGAAAGPDALSSVQPTTKNRDSRRPRERFILRFLSNNEKNEGGSGTNTCDSSRFSPHVDSLNGDERDAQ